MSKLKEQLTAGTFAVTAEIAPPKGVDTAEAVAKAEAMRDLAAVNVTDNQGANMRMAPLALAGMLQQKGIEPVLQLTCRDRNRLALQADLLGAAALGIENLLVVSGDHARFGDHPQARPVFDLDSVQLLQTVHTLGEGTDMAGKKLEGGAHFFAGAAVSPESAPFELMFQKFTKKIEAGASFFQTQAFFDPNHLQRFMSEAAAYKKPVLAGILLLKSARMAHFLNENIPGVQVPQPLVERLDKAEHPLEEGVAIARELVAEARSCCQGVHLMTLGCEERIPEILQ